MRSSTGEKQRTLTLPVHLVSELLIYFVCYFDYFMFFMPVFHVWSLSLDYIFFYFLYNFRFLDYSLKHTNNNYDKSSLSYLFIFFLGINIPTIVQCNSQSTCSRHGRWYKLNTTATAKPVCICNSGYSGTCCSHHGAASTCTC